MTSADVRFRHLSAPAPLSRRPPAAALLAGMLLLAAGGLHAQPGSVSYGPLVLERSVADRWVHAEQHPGFVPYTTDRTALHLRGSTSTSTALGSSRHLTFRSQAGGGASLSLDATGRVRSATIEQPPLTFGRYDDETARRDMRIRRLKGSGATLALPAARFWEVPFITPGTPLVHGVTWTDTLSFAAEAEGMWERLDGVWHNVVVGDTVIDGRRLPLVRTVADVRYRSSELEGDPATGTPFGIDRDVQGRLIGHAAVDTALSVRAAGMDSALLIGTAVLRLDEGRDVASSVRYDMRRTWLLRDSVAYAQWQDTDRAEAQRQSTGMLMLPRTPLEERLRAGNLALADSLYARWAATDDPDERAAIGRTLALTNARGTAGVRVEDQLVELRRAAGDTAARVQEILRSLGPLELTPELLPYLEDPARMWRLGVVPRFTYVQLATQLTESSPLLHPAAGQARCPEPFCGAVLALVETAAEPRLRDAALAGAFARDPARWFDRVAARADSGSRIARDALRLGLGVGATWPAAPGVPVPAADAPWQEWLHWLGGEVRWRASHANALRIYTARTGRDPVGELHARWPPAGDSARLVIGTILRGMDALPEPAAAELAAALLTGSPADALAAQRQLAARLSSEGEPAPLPLQLALLRPLLDSIAASAHPPWPTLPVLTGDGRLRSNPFAASFHGAEGVPVFVLDEQLPPEIAAALPPSWTLIDRAAWEARPLREGGALVRFSPIVQWGDFAAVGWDWSVYRRRAADEAPSGYAGGGRLYLLRTADGWAIASVSAWIT